MLTRILTGAVLIVIIGLGIWLKGWVLRAIMLIAMLVATDEMYRALERAGYRPERWVGYVYCALAVAIQACGALVGGVFRAIDPPLFSLTAGVMLGISVIVLRGKVDFDGLVSTLFPMVYPGLLFSLILALQDLGSPAAATLALILTFFIASVNDTFALFVGLSLGRHRLSPEISPKKSIEGSIGGLIAAMLFAMLAPVVAAKVWPAAASVAWPPLWAFALLGLLAGGLSQIGDLAASLIKRHCGIKDFGSIFPGHGGVMDRFDGILFCGAACYLFFKLMGL